MPSVVAHCWYGDVAFNKIADDSLRNAIKRNHGVYMLGCQGPDLFYYYHRFPWVNQKKNPKVHDFGNKLHEIIINDAIGKYCEYVIDSRNEIAIAYLAGYLAHWALDSTCHPYINYKTGSIKGNIGYDHQYFEEQIDKGLLDILNMSIVDYQPVKLVKHHKNLSRILFEMNKTVFDDIQFDEVRDSIKGFCGIQKFLYDPKGSKYKWISKAEDLFKLHGLATNMMLPQKYDNTLDALNLRQEEWLHPCDNSLASCETFEDLAKKAVGKMSVLFDILGRLLSDNATINDLLEVVGNKSFSTGMIVGEDMKYFEKDLKDGLQS